MIGLLRMVERFPYKVSREINDRINWNNVSITNMSTIVYRNIKDYIYERADEDIVDFNLHVLDKSSYEFILQYWDLGDLLDLHRCEEVDDFDIYDNKIGEISIKITYVTGYGNYKIAIDCGVLYNEFGIIENINFITGAVETDCHIDCHCTECSRSNYITYKLNNGKLEAF